MDTYGCTHMYVLVGMKARGNLSIFFRHCPPSFLRQGLSGCPEALRLGYIGLPVSPVELPVSARNSAGVTNKPLHDPVFTWVLTQILMLAQQNI